MYEKAPQLFRQQFQFWYLSTSININTLIRCHSEVVKANEMLYLYYRYIKWMLKQRVKSEYENLEKEEFIIVSQVISNNLWFLYNEQQHPYRIKNVDDDDDDAEMASGPLDVQINAIMMLLCLAFCSWIYIRLLLYFLIKIIHSKQLFLNKS